MSLNYVYILKLRYPFTTQFRVLTGHHRRSLLEASPTALCTYVCPLRRRRSRSALAPHTRRRRPATNALLLQHIIDIELGSRARLVEVVHSPEATPSSWWMTAKDGMTCSIIVDGFKGYYPAGCTCRWCQRRAQLSPDVPQNRRIALVHPAIYTKSPKRAGSEFDVE